MGPERNPAGPPGLGEIAAGGVADLGLSEITAHAGHDDPRTLAAVLESAPDGVVIFDSDGRIVDWNPAAEQLLGYRRSQAIGKDIVELVFPSHLRPAIRAVIESRASSWGTPDQRRIEVPARSASRADVPVELTLSWAPGSQFFAAHLVDASGRGERERELAADATRRASLLALGQRALAGVSLDELMTQALEAAAGQIGFERCEIWERRPDGSMWLRVGRGSSGSSRSLKPNPASRLGWALASGGLRAIAGGGRGGGSASIIDDDYGMAVAIPGPGEPFGVLDGTSSRIEEYSAADAAHLESLAQLLASAIERDRYERSLSEAEARVRGLIERLPSVTYQAGLGSEGRWHFISPQVEEILGLSVEECMRDPGWWERSVDPGDLPRVLDEEERCLQRGAPLDVEYRLRTRDGRTIWIRDRASSPRPGDDGEMVVEGLLIDVTTQKLAEEKLQHLADHDDLTGLLNRRAFEAAL
jgi:PAS domain S-box-containing protein